MNTINKLLSPTKPIDTKTVSKEKEQSITKKEDTQSKDRIEDKVSISKKGLDSVLSESHFDQKKVDELKQAIKDNTFKIDPTKIADGLISSVKEMLKNKA